MVTVNRIFGLDIMRFIAITLVIINHTYKYTLFSKLKYSIDFYLGFIGVEFFFILSGFLIGSILIKYNESNKIRLSQIKNFWIRRWFRTLPNYYLMLFIYFVVDTYINPSILLHVNYLSYCVFLQNFKKVHPVFLGPAWSLSIEEWFYLTFPLSIFCLQKIFKKKDAAFRVAIFIFIIGSLLFRLIASNNLTALWDSGFRKIMPLRLDAIAIGVLFAYFKTKNKEEWDTQKVIYFQFGSVGLCLLMFALAKADISVSNLNIFFKTLFFSLIPISIGFLLPYFDGIKTIKNQTITKTITHISLISYSMYLTHWLIIEIIDLNYFDYINNFYKFILVWFFTIVISSIQYQFFEKPMTTLREKFSNT
jgi:peptidoglycan/LPS O-acetylase OafA/YrhL